MKTIPLESTIAGAYRFLFTRIGSIIGTIWFPVLLLVAVMGGIVCLVVPHAWFAGNFANADAKEIALTLIPLFLLLIFVFLIGMFVVSAMIKVGILRHAIGEKTSPTFIYFSLGARVWRMVCVTLLGIVVAIGLEIAAAILYGVVNFGVAAIPNVPAVVVTLSNLVVAIVVVLGFIYVMTRLFFFLPAVVVAENKVGVARAWALGKGNVWRIIVVLIAVVVPTYFVCGALLYLTVIPTVLVQVIRHHPDGPQQALEFFKSLWPLLPMIGAIELVAIIALTGLTLGAIGKAYQAVTAPEEKNA